MPETHDITVLLKQINEKGTESIDRLIPIVYQQLKAIANNQMRNERSNHTLSSTALVHEAYLKLIDQKNVSWQNRAHFFAISAQAMRRILINHAHKKMAVKRGGDQAFVTLDEYNAGGVRARAEEFIELDRALEKLTELDERQARIVELRYFGGMTNREIAEVLKISEATVQRSWSVARAWLKREMSTQPDNKL